MPRVGLPRFGVFHFFSCYFLPFFFLALFFCSPKNDGSATPTSLVHSLVLGQLNCRGLWGRDGTVHDGLFGPAGNSFSLVFSLHSSMSQSQRWRLISGSLCACSFHAPAPHASKSGRTLAASIHRVSQLHTGLLCRRSFNLVPWYFGPDLSPGCVNQCPLCSCHLDIPQFLCLPTQPPSSPRGTAPEEITRLFWWHP